MFDVRDFDKRTNEQTNEIGAVYVWGSGLQGQLGLGDDIETTPIPTHMPLRRFLCFRFYLLVKVF